MDEVTVSGIVCGCSDNCRTFLFLIQTFLHWMSCIVLIYIPVFTKQRTDFYERETQKIVMQLSNITYKTWKFYNLTTLCFYILPGALWWFVILL